MMKNLIELNEFTEKLKNSDKLIIVEGPKDKEALEFFGIENVFVLNKGIAFFENIEKIKEKANEVIILTDFDKKGKELYGRLSKDLSKFGVKIDKEYREWLQRNTKLSHVEGLKAYIQNSNI